VLVLAFDTATPAVTVALGRLDVERDRVGGGAVTCEVLAESSTIDARRHGELLAPAIESAFAATGHQPGDLDAVAVGVGPGPFTGLRVGLVTARTLAHVLGIRAMGVCTLDVLAFDADLDGPYVVATDARRREVYWARFEGVARVDGPHVSRPGDVPVTGPVVGEGATLYPEHLTPGHPPFVPRAGAIIGHVAAGRPVLPVEPLYLRRPDVTVPRPRKSVIA
jgi:tRNA threonylcarbamoyl adenosine modification protein YeaZ